MERAQFVETVRKLETFAEREPAKYRRRVGLLAALGYGYVLLILAVVLAMLGGLLWIFLVGHRLNAAMIKLGIFLLIFCFVILRSLWVRFTPPQGIELSRQQVPELFAMIDDLTTRLNSPKFHHVLLTDDFNAAVSQQPRLGVLGWQKNYLLLGLPLMQALSAEEFRAVVAHELGHLSGNHGRFSGWIYRIYQTWDQLHQNFAHAGSGGGWVFEKFFNWYAPYFGAYSFVLRRTDEYVADRCSADLTSPHAAASALVCVNMKGRYLEEVFWPDQFKKVKESATPPTAPFSQTAQSLRSPFAPPATAPQPSLVPSAPASPPPLSRWLTRAFQDKTDYADTHPCLADRLTALGFKAHDSSLHKPEHWGWLPDHRQSTAVPSASAHYLGNAETALTQQLDTRWHEAVAGQWQEQHKALQEARTRIQELEQKAQTSPLTEEELWEQVTLAHELQGREAALPLAQQLLERNPEHAAAHYALGQMLLDVEDETGLEHLQRAAELEPEATLAAYGAIYHYLRDHGRTEEAEKYRDKSYDFHDTVEKALEERAQVSEKDEFSPPQLSEADLAKLREFLQNQKGVAQAYLACKKVEHFNNKPLHVMGIVRQKPAFYKFSEDNEKFMNNLLAALQQWEDHPLGFVYVMDGNTKKLSKKIEVVPGALVYKATS